jgi:hypothetical protein
MLEPYDNRKKIELLLVGLLLLAIVTYGFIRAYPLLRGPSIVIYYPHDGDVVASTTFEISGKVSHVKEISIQGRLIPIDTEGRFREILVAMPPYTILTLLATDFYGKTVTQTIRVVPQ